MDIFENDINNDALMSTLSMNREREVIQNSGNS